MDSVLRPFLALVAILAVTLSVGAQPAPSRVEGDHKATVQKYCGTCHNERTKSGGLVLENRDYANVPADAAIWEKALKKMRVGMMPPPSAPQPDPATRGEL